MVAAAQLASGEDPNSNYTGFGHSMVIDPWGDIIGQMSDEEGYFTTEINLEFLNQVRSNMNCLTHIRTDLLI